MSEEAPTHVDILVKLGRMEERMIALADDVHRLADDNKAQTVKIDQIERELANAKGAWKMLTIIAAVVGFAFSTLATKLGKVFS